jgi:uncharacterized protein YcbX
MADGAGQEGAVTATIAALYRHPVKGFTPEALTDARLEADGWFPDDRLYAVEYGPSGFDPEAPVHLSKMKFAVLARDAALARVRTRYDAPSRTLTVEAQGRPTLTAALDQAEGRRAFADWLTDFLGEDAAGPLRILSAPGHRFMDSRRGHVSLLNLASVRDLEARVGRSLDPRRFRANVWVEGWPAWIEMEGADREVRLGAAGLEGLKPIVRCAATHVDPDTGERDFDLVSALFTHYGHRDCGLYAAIRTGGPIAVGDAVEMMP